MSRNPYRRCHDITGASESAQARNWWRAIDRRPEGGEWHALHLRWAARHACRRLRQERDEARARADRLESALDALRCRVLDATCDAPGDTLGAAIADAERALEDG